MALPSKPINNQQSEDYDTIKFYKEIKMCFQADFSHKKSQKIWHAPIRVRICPRHFTGLVLFGVPTALCNESKNQD